MKNKIRKYGLMAVAAIGYVALGSLTSKFTRGGETIEIGKASFSPSQIAGVLSSVRTLLLVIVLYTDRVLGFWVDLVIWFMSAISIIVMFIGGRMDTVPGIAQNLMMLAVMVIIYNFMKREAKSKDKFVQLSAQDSLTRLLNRRAFNDTLDEIIGKKASFTLCALSVENYQHVNSTLGNDYGDRMLLEGAHRLKSMQTPNEICARISGADFAVLIRDTKDFEADCVKIAQYVEKLEAKMRAGNAELQMKIKAAVVRFPEDGKDRNELLRHLDSTLTLSKTKKKHAIEFYSEAIVDEMSREMRIEERLMEALENNLFHLVFQPQYSAVGKVLRGFETLARLEDADGNPIPPSEFIEIAERRNLIYRIDTLVMEKALTTFAPCLKQHPELTLSINVSAKHLLKPGYADIVIGLVQKCRFPAPNLEIEITETAFADDMEAVLNSLEKIRDYGINIALDDFGTGYASLSLLSMLPVNLLKIDKYFIDQMDDSETGDEFVRTIISLGHILKLDVVAEGVETEEQLNRLKNWDCDLIQGFFWGRPMDFEKAKEIMDKK